MHIDDDQDDLFAFKEALSLLPHEISLVQQQEATSALRYLRSINNRSELPHLVVVDLNMPGISGKEFLAIVKTDPVLKEVPVIAFTTSSLLSDKHFCACLGVACITKPALFDEMVKVAGDMLSSCG